MFVCLNFSCHLSANIETAHLTIVNIDPINKLLFVRFFFTKDVFVTVLGLHSRLNKDLIPFEHISAYLIGFSLAHSYLSIESVEIPPAVLV